MVEKKKVPDYLKEALVRYCEGRQCAECIFENGNCPDPHGLEIDNEEDEEF